MITMYVSVCVFVYVSMFVYLFQLVCLFIVCIDVARADNLATGPHFVVCCDNLVTTCDTFRLFMYYAILLLKAPHRVNNN